MFLLILHRKPKNDKTMNYIKAFALLISLSILASSCTDREDFPSDVYSKMNTKASEPSDTTGTSRISIIIDEPDVEDIDYAVTIP